MTKQTESEMPMLSIGSQSELTPIQSKRAEMVCNRTIRHYQANKPHPWQQIAHGLKPRVFDYLDKNHEALRNLIFLHIMPGIKILAPDKRPNKTQLTYLVTRISSYVVQYGWTAWDLAKFLYELPSGTWGKMYGAMEVENVVYAMNEFQQYRINKLKGHKLPEELTRERVKPEELPSSDQMLKDIEAMEQRIADSKKPQQAFRPKRLERDIVGPDGKVYKVNAVDLQQVAHQWEARAKAEAMATEQPLEVVEQRHGGSDGKMRYCFHILKTENKLK